MPPAQYTDTRQRCLQLGALFHVTVACPHTNFRPTPYDCTTAAGGDDNQLGFSHSGCAGGKGPSVLQAPRYLGLRASPTGTAAEDNACCCVKFVPSLNLTAHVVTFSLSKELLLRENLWLSIIFPGLKHFMELLFHLYLRTKKSAHELSKTSLVVVFTNPDKSKWKSSCEHHPPGNSLRLATTLLCKHLRAVQQSSV